MTKNSLDIILPCYNPSESWEQDIVLAISKIENMVPNYLVNTILVNDGSTYGFSQKQITYLKNHLKSFKFIDLKENKGKGAAIRTGFAQSYSNYAFFTDIDFPYQEANLLSMLKELENGADLVIGKRNNDYYKKVPFIRKTISKVFKRIIRIVFRIPTSDTQAGLKAFSKEAKSVLLTTTINRYLFDLELVKRAYQSKLKFAFIDLELKDNIQLSKMSLKILFGELSNLLKIIFL